MVRHCLVRWLKESRWDVWTTERLPPESRFEGAVGMFPYDDGKKYLGKVLKISANVKDVLKAEADLSNELKSTKVGKGQKRAAAAPSRIGKQASDNEVAKVLGERKTLSETQVAAKKAATAAKRKKDKAVEEVTSQEDDALFASVVSAPSGAKRTLFDQSHDLLSDEEGGDDSADDLVEVFEGEFDKVAGDDKAASEKAASDDDTDDEVGEPTLMSYRNPNTVGFLKFLLKEFSPSKSPKAEEKEYAKPILEPDLKMVRLKKGHSLRISKGSRARLLIDFKSRKNPTVFLRKTLVELYGDEQLSQMTAKGRLKSSCCIYSDLTCDLSSD